jgi:large subunit ribosomal protein L25
MEHATISATNRTELRKGAVGRIRRSGKIPAILYGRQGNAVSLALDEKEFLKGIKGVSESTILKLQFDGKDHSVFLKDTQHDLLSGKILHVDFYEIAMGQQVKARVSLRIVGTPEGVRLGGIFENPIHDIEVECEASILPERIDVDVSGLGVNQSIHVKDLNLDPKIRLLSSAEQVIAVVKFAKIEVEPVVEEAVATEEAAPEGEEAEAGAAAAAAPEAASKA